MMDADSAQPKITRLSPDPFPLSRAGSGDKTTIKYNYVHVGNYRTFLFFQENSEIPENTFIHTICITIDSKVLYTTCAFGKSFLVTIL